MTPAERAARVVAMDRTVLRDPREPKGPRQAVKDGRWDGNVVLAARGFAAPPILGKKW
ncbi:MAG: hypothetical protein AB7V08_14035 [Elusimicrobiales bacterium]